MLYIEKEQPIITAIPINLMELGPLRAMLFNDGNDITTYFTMRDGDLYLNLLDGTFQAINNGDFVYKVKIHEGTENEQYVYATMSAHLFLEKYKLLSNVVEENKIFVENTLLADRIAGKLDEKGKVIEFTNQPTPEIIPTEIPNSALANKIAGIIDEQGNEIMPNEDQPIEINEDVVDKTSETPPKDSEPFYPNNDL